MLILLGSLAPQAEHWKNLSNKNEPVPGQIILAALESYSEPFPFSWVNDSAPRKVWSSAFT